MPALNFPHMNREPLVGTVVAHIWAMYKGIGNRSGLAPDPIGYETHVWAEAGAGDSGSCRTALPPERLYRHSCRYPGGSHTKCIDWIFACEMQSSPFGIISLSDTDAVLNGLPVASSGYATGPNSNMSSKQ